MVYKQLKNTLLYFLKVPEAIAKVRDELKGIFDGVIDGFADAMREGESELDDAIDEMNNGKFKKHNVPMDAQFAFFNKEITF